MKNRQTVEGSFPYTYPRIKNHEENSQTADHEESHNSDLIPYFILFLFYKFYISLKIIFPIYETLSFENYKFNFGLVI